MLVEPQSCVLPSVIVLYSWLKSDVHYLASKLIVGLYGIPILTKLNYWHYVYFDHNNYYAWVMLGMKIICAKCCQL